MVKSVCSLAAATILMTASAGVAQETIKGVYMGSAELCAQAKKDGLQSVIENNFMILTDRGFETIEFNCAFLQFTKHPRMPAGWVVTSMCEEPDNAYPEMFSIVERQGRRVGSARGADGGQSERGTSSREPAEGGEDAVSSGLTGTYYLCEGVNRP